MKIGVFGGTFDPFTCAHYEIVKTCLESNAVDKVIILPTIVDYYRQDKNTLFSINDRRSIIEHWMRRGFIQAGHEEDVILDFYEYDVVLKHDEKTVESRRYLHMLEDVISRHGKSNEYFTIVGGDSFEKFRTWYKWEDILKLSRIIAFPRDSIVDSSEIDTGKPFSRLILTIDDRFVAMSASSIRERLEDDVSGMSMGPSATCLNLYLEEVDEYLETGKTYEERQQELVEVEKKMMESIQQKSKSGNKLIAHTPIFDVLRCQEVEEGFRPIKVRAPEWVAVIAEKEGKFLMVKQMRHGLEKEFEEFPCGMVELGEDVVEAGLRELEEETGVKIQDKRSVHYLGKFAANPAFMTNYMHYLHVNLDYALHSETKTNLDPHEHLTSFWASKNEAFDAFVKSEGSAIMGSAWMLLMRAGIVQAKV